ncbi:MAG TPA: NADPH-dependent 7-cyano-7-deazaguanine reductase QueF [Firmicutes bacterium]|nr:NADPH-dependent 7-cyano-7-deazaguanine reductase QueF [Bacillota bacterium]
MKEYTAKHAKMGISKKLPRIATWPNQYKRDYSIVIETAEFTSVCPKTGLPDFGSISISYIPDKECLELKSLKFYLLTYRDLGIFTENAVNKILDDCVRACAPKWMKVEGRFTPRGGLNNIVSAEYSGRNKPARRPGEK